jgi:hypothetical protein
MKFRALKKFLNEIDLADRPSKCRIKIFPQLTRMLRGIPP